jgi:hypothetical protein
MVLLFFAHLQLTIAEMLSANSLIQVRGDSRIGTLVLQRRPPLRVLRPLDDYRPRTGDYPTRRRRGNPRQAGSLGRKKKMKNRVLGLLLCLLSAGMLYYNWHLLLNGGYYYPK